MVSARISSSAFLSLGTNEHENGLGPLEEVRQNNRRSVALLGEQDTYVMLVPVNVYSSGLPSARFTPSILKTEMMDAMTINIVVSTKCLPGQIRFPYPNADTQVESSRMLPSELMNRLGLKASGSEYTAGSCKIALRKIEASIDGNAIVRVSYHPLGMTREPDDIHQQHGDRLLL